MTVVLLQDKGAPSLWNMQDAAHEHPSCASCSTRQHHKISLKMGKTSGWEEMAQWI